MAAHAEELHVHGVDEHSEIKIEKKLGSILYGDVADDEVQIVQRNEYVKVGFACLM